MPKYRPTDLPRIVHIPLEDLARGDSQMTDAEVALRIATALHEAAHVLAGGACRASITEVTVSATGRASRSGKHGGVQISGRTDRDEAFISLVGYAWEEGHGDVAFASRDLNDGLRHAAGGQLSCDQIMDEARTFVRDHVRLIRAAAAGILGVLPKSGVLKGRALQRLYEWFLPVRPARALVPISAAGQMLIEDAASALR